MITHLYTTKRKIVSSIPAGTTIISGKIHNGIIPYAFGFERIDNTTNRVIEGHSHRCKNSPIVIFDPRIVIEVFLRCFKRIMDIL